MNPQYPPLKACVLTSLFEDRQKECSPSDRFLLSSLLRGNPCKSHHKPTPKAAFAKMCEIDPYGMLAIDFDILHNKGWHGNLALLVLATLNSKSVLCSRLTLEVVSLESSARSRAGTRRTREV